MNKQRCEYLYFSYVCFSVVYDFVVGDVGVVFKILFIILYIKKNNMVVIDKIFLLVKEYFIVNDLLCKLYVEKKLFVM